jgi:hypothetical protein
MPDLPPLPPQPARKLATEIFTRMLERLGLLPESQTYRSCVAEETDL